MKMKIACLILCAMALSIVPRAASAATSYQYEYDKNNRLTHVYIGGVPTYYGFKYDKNGNLLKVEQLGKITNVTATPNNNYTNGYCTATLTWTAPTIGSPTGYRVYKNGSYVATISTVTSYTYSRLTNGQYTFSVAAIFDSGEGQRVSTGPVQVTATSGGGVTPGDPPPAG